ncbi:hypothetical protein ES703_124200 [subsurface metagenome]
MSKGIKAVMVVVAAILIITAGTAIAATSVMADEGATETATGEVTGLGAGSRLLVRVAEILGIPQDELFDVVQQAWQELREEGLEQATCDECLNEECRERFKQQAMNRAEAGAAKRWGQVTETQNEEGIQRSRTSSAMRGRHMTAVPAE